MQFIKYKTQHYRSTTKRFLYVYPRFSTTSTIVIQVFTQHLDSHMKRPKAQRGTCLKSL